MKTTIPHLLVAQRLVTAEWERIYAPLSKDPQVNVSRAATAYATADTTIAALDLSVSVDELRRSVHAVINAAPERPVGPSASTIDAEAWFNTVTALVARNLAAVSRLS